MRVRYSWQEARAHSTVTAIICQKAASATMRVPYSRAFFAFKNTKLDFAEIGKKLGVHYVLEGSVRKAGQRLRITAQLIKCSDGFHLWSERFDRNLDGVFAIQDEIAHAVTDKLRVTFGVGPARTPGGTDNAEAYDLMLRARSLVRRRHAGDPERAAELLHRALKTDPLRSKGQRACSRARAAIDARADHQPL